MAAASPLWNRIADMNFPRTNVNGVILPDGNVLICAGIDGYKWGPNTPTLQAELFDPQSGSWTTVASMSVVRQYHSVSLLLPDGRVLNTGGVGGPGNIMSMEIYSPPYLFRGPRPRITSSPASVTYDEHVSIESPDACRIRKVAMIRRVRSRITQIRISDTFPSSGTRKVTADSISGDPLTPTSLLRATICLSCSTIVACLQLAV